MDGNKDESVKCLHLGKHHLKQGNLDKAHKYFLKSDRLFPSSEAKVLLNMLNSMNGTNKFGSPNNEVHGSPKIRRRRNSSGRSKHPNEKDWTDDQVVAVEKIKACKNYYEVLGVTKEATDSDLKKQYKKLALQFHPDKNKAPGASEAFKVLGNAYAVLSDPQKRKHYDMVGSEARENVQCNSEFYHTTFEGNMSAEDFFNFIFGNDGRYFARGPRCRSNPQTFTHRAQTPEAPVYTFVHLLPILFVFLVSTLMTLFFHEPHYSLSLSRKYPIQRQTENLNFPYYVMPNFPEYYKGNLKDLEDDVEDDYIHNLHHACYRERHYKESILFQAKAFGDKKKLSRANEIKTPSCDKLQIIMNKIS